MRQDGASLTGGCVALAPVGYPKRPARDPGRQGSRSPRELVEMSCSGRSPLAPRERTLVLRGVVQPVPQSLRLSQSLACSAWLCLLTAPCEQLRLAVGTGHPLSPRERAVLTSRLGKELAHFCREACAVAVLQWPLQRVASERCRPAGLERRALVGALLAVLRQHAQRRPQPAAGVGEAPSSGP